MTLDELVHSAKVWRAGEVPPGQALPTGFPALDTLLPTRGWPYPALIEVLTDFEGIGALRLWLPTLAAMSQQQRWVIWVAPPYQPYAPALQQVGLALSRLLLVDASSAAVEGTASTLETGARTHQANLWTFEQALRFATGGAAVGWFAALEPLVLRRLQLASEIGSCLGVLFRPARYATQSSPATLRLLLTRAPGAGLTIQLLKCRGNPRVRSCTLVFEE
jgi:hypothetical protein